MRSLVSSAKCPLFDCHVAPAGALLGNYFGVVAANTFCGLLKKKIFAMEPLLVVSKVCQFNSVALLFAIAWHFLLVLIMKIFVTWQFLPVRSLHMGISQSDGIKAAGDSIFAQ